MDPQSSIKRILLIADDQQPAFRVLKMYLGNAGFELTTVTDGNAVRQTFAQNQPNLVILDLDLKGEDGLKLFFTLRHETDIPILLLTINVEQASHLIDGGMAVDDYMAKPFSPYKVVARVHAILQHLASEQAIEDVICLGDLMIDLNGHMVSRANQSIMLSRTEFNILALLAKHPKRVFSRAQIIELVKVNAIGLGERTIDAHIKNLRAKLEPNPQKPVYIRTVFGLGYKFEL